jgi:predicted TIM-barrel fold metal-dependent hydrolase
VRIDTKENEWEFQEAEEGVLADVWVYEGVRSSQSLVTAAAGYRLDDLSNEPICFDVIRPGCYDPRARLEDMDVAGVEAQACFPNSFLRFCGQRFLYSKDKELGRLCVEAYNDWMLEEWCGGSGGRLLPIGIIPLWDATLAAREVERTAERGMHAVCFSEVPPQLGLPSIHCGYWDPFFAACAANGTAILMHIASSSQVPKPSPDSPFVVTSSLMAVNSAMAMMDWLFSGNLIRYPQLRLGFCESQAGWIPYFLQRADEVWDMRRSWGSQEVIKEPPSTQVPGRIFYSTFGDPVAFNYLMDCLGSDNIMFETDYPHNDTNWPHCSEVAYNATKELDPATREKVLRTNARTLFSLD